ncbi:response regulator transcription factor [Taibaiella chishuiensis]|uniref:DNA-binding response OmpR family regulator n=1 Tax=Taibaiella chishuiensis TaxID=1434707 RepID=A0A2P8CZN1_9BACT|nr:response regulator transcription factor [Taibaiella chishuiensis]PSK90421.1 DNA-binding response OmpR family regulator [Taibaiella chishuiensis]
MKVLIIEDEQELSSGIAEYLSGELFVCEIAHDFDSGMGKALRQEYSCIVLDISLGNGNGMDILYRLQQEGKAEGVIIISAKHSLDDKINGLNAGADDYLSKPFHLSELAARISAIIRRKSFGGRNVLDFNELSLNLQDKTIRVNGRDISCTRKEYDLLLYFISNPNSVLSKAAIAEHLWANYTGEPGNHDIIYTHIKNLRKKMLKAGSRDYIESIYGMGYRFKTD